MIVGKEYIVITGASSGIGYASAEKFAAENFNLILVARRKKRLSQLKEKLNIKYPLIDVVIMICDLSVESEVHDLYDNLKSYNLKALINNAGSGIYGRVVQNNVHEISKMIQLNITAVTILSALFIKDYKNESGVQLINVSSRAGYTLVNDSVIYSATKFYVNAFTEGLIHEMSDNDSKLRVKIFAPGATKTEFDSIAQNNSAINNDFGFYDSASTIANRMFELYNSDFSIGIVSFDDNQFLLKNSIFDSRMDK